ncbi:metalloprotease ybeY [Nitritalea halalkaliphila LW7]|uniref:Endoribonuclease YbeY n=1 Tax=Nitritalea halalkaliphila LW7 TaxID=1189621 RepID=I5C5H0_9BACT|nr:rRNA maturation RNase YbeY [Nitritalea halalkaliphila]EIM77072.1 metalloprotease ybeY [Nitritalea halalkaliphila LW7]
MAISFFVEDVRYDLKPKNTHKKWLRTLAQSKGFTISELSYVFCSDPYLHEMNVNFLNHDTYTDIITFDQSDDPTDKTIEGDIYISVDRVKENAAKLAEPVEVEMRRVLAHGLLHLMGFKDKSEEEARAMRAAEDDAIAQYETI